mgnify:CR=1 FL=1
MNYGTPREVVGFEGTWNNMPRCGWALNNRLVVCPFVVLFRSSESLVHCVDHMFVTTAPHHLFVESLDLVYSSLALLNPWLLIGVRFRSVSVREGVYEVLARLAEERGVSISDVIAELINCYLGNAIDLSKHLSEVKELLRQCLDNLGRQQTTTQLVAQPTNTHEVVGKPGKTAESPLIGFEDNPWVQIIRSKVMGDEDREGR